MVGWATRMLMSQVERVGHRPSTLSGSCTLSRMVGMARASLVLSILVASPGDVPAERDAVVEAINQWNSEHSRQMKLHLEGVRWETHAHPATGGRPQGFVNQQVADACDCAIAVFGTRIGTPTGEAESGTIEEIERLRSRGKGVGLYFSNASLPRGFDEAQYAALKHYRKARETDSLVWEFSGREALEGFGHPSSASAR